jgi:4-hydroxybenzoate polyprenyltransferase/phosphoserine phosphatase
MTLNKKIPLCVDCDNSLIATDLLYEACFLLIKQNPMKLFSLPLWLLKGKAYLKERLAEYVTFDFASLPYRPEVLEIIKEATKQERSIVLATASPRVWAEAIANHLNCFSEVIATEHNVNLSAKNKADKLVSKFGSQGYDYIGDSQDDVVVWKHALNSIVINKKNILLRKESKFNGQNVTHIKPPSLTFLSYIKAIRVYQWMKNGLIFVPLLASHQFLNVDLLIQAVFAFFAFSFCASSVYILNDLLDLESDRQHVTKHKRPFASGLIPVLHGAILAPVLLAVAIYISITYLPTIFDLTLVIYYVMTLAYSLKLKQQVIVDVLLLAALYTIRILAGSAATNIEPSFWLLEFSLFIFLSLALVKRYTEMSIALDLNKKSASGRGYFTEDLSVLMSIGVASAMCSVMVFSLYINSSEADFLYSSRYWLWGVVPFILYWNSRLWMKTRRKEIPDDPVLFAVYDWQTLIMLPAIFSLFLLASN